MIITDQNVDISDVTEYHSRDKQGDIMSKPKIQRVSVLYQSGHIEEFFAHEDDVTKMYAAFAVGEQIGLTQYDTQNPRDPYTKESHILISFDQVCQVVVR